MYFPTFRKALFCAALFSAFTLNAQELSQRSADFPAPIGPAQTPNSHAAYKQLRNISLSGEAITVNNFTLKRDAGTFTFASGTFYGLAPIDGKVTGAVFVGEGRFSLIPPTEGEKKHIAILTKEPAFNEELKQLVMRFTDNTWDEIKQAGTAASGASSPGALDALKDVQKSLRTSVNFRYNLEGRLLQDVLSNQPGRLFWAFIKGGKYGNKTLFQIDPWGNGFVAPEEVALIVLDDMKFGVWSAFHFEEERTKGTANSREKNYPIDIQHQQIDAAIERSARLSGVAITTFSAQIDGLRVVPFDLFPDLRVSSVSDDQGQQLGFIQEDKDEDADFFVVLPRALKKGEQFRLRTAYAGKEAVVSTGDGNYYPVSRTNWYPNTSFGDYSTYELVFRTPKGQKMVASGTPIKQIVEGDLEISEWKSEVPQAVAGFNLGKFKKEEAKLTQPDYLVESYANETTPYALRALESSETGTLSTTPMMKKALAEGQLSVQLFSEYFGPLPYKRVAMTQQTAAGYGQAWPALVYMPLSAYLDTTQRNALGWGAADSFFKIVGPHEVAHQWWGHMVGFNSYRDQWMSEGFAELSASIFTQVVQRNDKEFQKFWKEELDLITQKNKEGYRAIDVGPVTMGYRLSTAKAGQDIPRRMIYPKGAFILHMLRMMMWHNKTGDDRFKVMMRDFTSTYANAIATTEDFKAIVEKHMTEQMDVDGNRKMDWFFNQYVYGTALPEYKLDYSFGTENGQSTLNVKITQSGVDDKFVMLVPLYVEWGNGKVTRLGAAQINGNSTVEQKIPLGKDKPKKAMLNYYYDVLGLVSQK